MIGGSSRNKPTREEALRIFRVDTEAGRLFWRVAPRTHPRLAGKEAGTPRPHSHNRKTYWVVKIGGHPFKRAQIIYLVANGKWPSPCVDHINGNSLDDRAVNLRLATNQQNAWNIKSRVRKSDLPMGVRQIPSGRYAARIRCRRKLIHIGVFDSISQATAAYEAKRRELYGEFA